MTTIQSPVLREYLHIEHALELWRQQRGYELYGCGHAERMAFEAGYHAGIRAVDQAAQAAYLVPHDG